MLIQAVDNILSDYIFFMTIIMRMLMTHYNKKQKHVAPPPHTHTHSLFLSHSCPLFSSPYQPTPQARGEVPRLPNGVPEKSSRPDRPRARDRPKPRRRPRPKEPGETTRRSRSAPAQSCPAVPQPPTHTAHHEGFLFRKLDIESLKKSANRWAFRVINSWSGPPGTRSYREGVGTLTAQDSDPGVMIMRSEHFSPSLLQLFLYCVGGNTAVQSLYLKAALCKIFDHLE